MISNQILQGTIEGLKAITRKDITVVEQDGKVAASTNMAELSGPSLRVDEFVGSQAEIMQLNGSQYFKVLDNGITEYVVLIAGEDEEAYRVGKITAFSLQNLLVAYKERYDRDNFIKNLLLDNLLLVDIYNRAKKLHIESSLRRVVYLIEMEADKDLTVVEVVRGMFPTKQRDFVTAVDENNIVLVKELRDRESAQDVEDYARSICDTVSTEAMTRVNIAIGTIVTDLKNVSSSYKEARMAQEVGKIFETNKQIVNYENLGIGRLIYQLPLPLCRMFIHEVLQDIGMDQFDDETLTTISKFFERDLNVSETSRQLYIHRNTLVYRLDKMQRQTGLDLRCFNDAVTFKITQMVYQYMQYKERHSY